MRGAILFVMFFFVSAVCALAWVEQNRAAATTDAASAGNPPSGSNGSDAANGRPDVASRPPEVRQQIVEESLHGVTIRDPYRYLEDNNNPETQRYVTEELAYTRSVLDPLAGRAGLHARLQQLLSTGQVGIAQVGQRAPKGQNYYFYTRRDEGQNQPVLYVREGLTGKDRVLVDVNAMNAEGTTALDWWHPSHDGKYVCYGISENGSEISTLQVIESATGKLLPEKIIRTRAASIAWKKDNSGFFYTRYPRPGEVKAGDEVYYRRAYYHQLGAAPDGSADKLVFSYDKDPQAWPDLRLSNDDRWLLISVAQGWSKITLHLKDLKADSEPAAISPDKDFIYDGYIYHGTIYIRTNEDAPRFRVFSVSVENPQRQNWKEIIPQTPGPHDAVLHRAQVIGGKLALAYEKDATARLQINDLTGKKLADVGMPGLGDIIDLGGNYDSDELFFNYQSFAQPHTDYRVSIAEAEKAAGKSIPASAWATVKSSIDSTQYEVKQVFYSSKDGTQVPMFLVSKKGTAHKGHMPVLLTGYGGFNLSNNPQFRAHIFLWLDHGGTYAVANLRGGAEYGEDWHRAGMLQNKQNVFDDFIAAAEYLINEKYTDKDHLAILGGSNGGLLVGAAFTQRPDLYRAVICQVPLLDMLRYQNFQIAKLWIPEYGSAEDPEQFKWLYAYSPYHHVKEGTEYPAILFMTADTDTRVDPMHAKKMAALMQAEAKNGGSKERPILLRIEPKAGHGAGKPISKQVEEYTDIYSFLFWQLGVKP
ncbi:MAG TPA: prolyl oligopeptidase family serine peptidase [Terriglobales bacterium]